jgi:2-dehydropantoate 2-reductase
MGRYVVVGAGAIGGTIGGRLHQAGHDVVLVARGAHGEALAAAGLLLRDPTGEARLPIPTVARPADVGWQGDEVAVLATKLHQAAAALDDLAAAAPPASTVVCATNGVEGERLALRRFASVVAMAVLMPADHLTPGVVSVYSAPVAGLLDVGRYPSGVDAEVERIAADLTGAGFASRPEAELLRRKRQKLLMNLANVLDAAVADGVDTGPHWAAAIAEARACFAAAGLDVAPDEEDAARRAESGMRMQPIDGERRVGGSTWQSLARGLGTEADYLNGEVVLLGRLHGVPTPVNEALQRLGRDVRTPRSLTADDLAERVPLAG